MDIFGTVGDYTVNIACSLLTVLVIKAKIIYFALLKNTPYGQKHAVEQIKNRLENLIKRKEKSSKSSPYGVENLFSLEKISSLLEFPNKKKGENIIIKYIIDILKNDKDWDNLFFEIRLEVNKIIDREKISADSNKVEKALKDFLEELCKIILKVSGGKDDDTYKIDALRQIMEKSKYYKLLPKEFRLHVHEMDKLEEIQKSLENSFSRYFEDSDQHLYFQIRGKIWWDELVRTATKLRIYKYLPDSFIFGVSLFLQHAPIPNENFMGMEKCYSKVAESKEFIDNLPDKDKIEENLDGKILEDVWRVCKASWDRQFFKDLIQGVDSEDSADIKLILLAAASIRIVNLATPYPSGNEDREKLGKRLDKISKVGWDEIPNDVYSLCIAALAEKVWKLDTEASIPEECKSCKPDPDAAICICPFEKIPEEFDYLFKDAFINLLNSELKFISDCFKKVYKKDKDFEKFLKGFREKEVRICDKKKDDSDKVSASKWMNIPGPSLLAESGLLVLAHIDKSTASSSEIADRFAKGLIAVLNEPKKTDKEVGISVDRLKNVANGLRPQLGRVQNIVKLVEESKKSGTGKIDLNNQIKEYLNKVEEMRNSAVFNAVEELKKKKPKKGSFVCFLFGFGKPLWATIKKLSETNNNLVLVTAPLRPVGEAGEVLIIKKFNEDRISGTAMNVQAVLVPDEAISDVLRNGLCLDGDIQKPAFCLMGCEAYDEKGNVINSAGCRTVAILAANASVPFYVVTESDKCVASVNKTKIATVDSSRFIDGRYSTEVLSDRNQWHVAEVVEKKFITGGIITDTEILSPKSKSKPKEEVNEADSI